MDFLWRPSSWHSFGASTMGISWVRVPGPNRPPSWASLFTFSHFLPLSDLLSILPRLGRYLGEFGAITTPQDLTSPRFLIGLALWAIGLGINIHSDHVLRNLRKPGETDYKIPHGGAFEFVSGALGLDPSFPAAGPARQQIGTHFSNIQTLLY